MFEEFAQWLAGFGCHPSNAFRHSRRRQVRSIAKRPVAVIIGLSVMAVACGGGGDSPDNESRPIDDAAAATPASTGRLSVSGVGFDEGVATITNSAGEAIDLCGHWLCNRPTYVALPDQVLEPGESIEVDLGELAANGGEVGLYSSRNFGDREAIVDYVTWGSGGGRLSVAEDGGVWSGATAESGDATTLDLVGDPGTAEGWAATATETTVGGESAADDQAADESESIDGAAAIADGTADWSVERVGSGIKPALAIDPDGQPAIAYLTEAIEGGVFLVRRGDGWTTETVAEGYFYGPIDLAFDPDRRANIVYHDHQETTFKPELGDLTLARSVGGAWEISASGDDGHDGWDPAIRFGPGGELWAAGIEPVDFGTNEGVEFYELRDGQWQVDAIGSPPITYEFNVAMATDPTGEPVLSYYDDGADRVHVATRTGGGWTDEAVNESGTGGMFSSLVIDDNGNRHLTYYASDDRNAGSVMYAVDDGSGWQFETVHELTAAELGMTGARRITSLRVLDDGTPVVASTDRSGVWMSTRSTDGWITESVLVAGDRPLGQQVQLVVDGDTWSLVTFEVMSASPLEGEILYLERTL
jgi:hypothetical protein